jgi:hypothetical protein
MPQNHMQAHIDLIAQHEQDFLAQRTATEQLGDRLASFVGSLAFVVQLPESQALGQKCHVSVVKMDVVGGGVPVSSPMV